MPNKFKNQLLQVNILRFQHASQEVWLSYPNIPEHFYAEADIAARSIYKLIKYLIQQRYNMGPVVSEAYPKFQNRKAWQAYYLILTNHATFYPVNEIKYSFPEGLPKQFSNLTQQQKNTLMVFGPEAFLLTHGYIDQLYSANDCPKGGGYPLIRDESIYRKPIFNMETYKKTLKDFLITQKNREFLGLNNCIEAMKDSQKNNAYLLFGADHSFSSVSKCIPELKIKTQDFVTTEEFFVDTVEEEYKRLDKEAFNNISDCQAIVARTNDIINMKCRPESFHYDAILFTFIIILLSIFIKKCCCIQRNNPDDNAEQQPVMQLN